MVLKIFLFLVLGYVLFELMEHAVIPLAHFILKKKRKAYTGSEALVGEVGEVKEWHDAGGMVFVHGELWRATGGETLSRGDQVEVLGVEGLILKVRRLRPGDRRSS